MSSIHEPTNDELFDFFISEAEHPFSGWNFSHIFDTRRRVEAPLPWNYASKILLKIRQARSLLDMDTGGGEFLSWLQPLPEHTCATESYLPNVPVARQMLEPLGIKVYEVHDPKTLPFEDNQFDLVINRHGYYFPPEVLRILKPGGQLITQQVGGQNELELYTLLGASENTAYAHWNLAYAIQELEGAGFEIFEQQEDFPIARFFDVGAIVYHLKAISWLILDFSIERYFEKLLAIHNSIQTQNYLDVRSHRFFLVAQKTA